MSAFDGRERNRKSSGRFEDEGRYGNVETMLFEALVHQLLEKGVFTKSDALSVIQTVAEVRKADQSEGEVEPRDEAGEQKLLSRLYQSFQQIRERSSANADQYNVVQLRRPLHNDAPQFPHDG